MRWSRQEEQHAEWSRQWAVDTIAGLQERLGDERRVAAALSVLLQTFLLNVSNDEQFLAGVRAIFHEHIDREPLA